MRQSSSPCQKPAVLISITIDLPALELPTVGIVQYNYFVSFTQQTVLRLSHLLMIAMFGEMVEEMTNPQNFSLCRNHH